MSQSNDSQNGQPRQVEELPWLASFPNGKPSNYAFGAGAQPLAEPEAAIEEVVVDERGELRLSEAQRSRWGVTPGARFLVERTPESLVLRRADPAIGKVYVEPTSRCNLSCRTCVRHSWDEPAGTMEMSTYRALIEGLRRTPTLQTVAFWGFGEPLLHRDIAEMIALAKGLGAKTELVTNALLLDQKRAAALIEAGLDTLVVSVDGTSTEAQADIRSGADLRTVVENVAELRAIRDSLGSQTPEIGLEFVLMRRNLHELASLRQLAHKMGARFIVLTNILPYTKELSGEALYGFWAGRSYTTSASLTPEVRMPRIDARRETLEPIVAMLEHAEIAGPSPRRFPGAPGHCRFVNEGSVVVGWNGEVSPCVALLRSYTVYVHGREKRIRRYSVGNVREQPIDAIWQKGEFVAFRKRVLDFNFSPCTDCGSCEFSEANETDCFGNPFPTCGDCLWGKGVIQCP